MYEPVMSPRTCTLSNRPAPLPSTFHQAVGLGIGMTEVADLAVDDVHARFQRRGAVAGQARAHADEGALEAGVLAVRRAAGGIPGRDLGGLDMDVAVVRGDLDPGIGGGGVVALEPELVDVTAGGAAVQLQGR